jgi:lysophospholipase L1-like esterase
VERNGFERYIALGDSISIDLYPALDAGGWASVSDEQGLGAASLFHCNSDRRFPEFRGRDLANLVPAATFRNGHALSGPVGDQTDNLTTDAATTLDVLELQITRVRPSSERTLVTLTAGGNDMLQMLGSRNPPRDLVPTMISRFHRILDEIQEKLPDSLIIAGTVYDPSDGTFILNGERFDHEGKWLESFNAAVRDAAKSREGVVVADIHAHFLGHGVSAPESDRWYWPELIFEPNVAGASEVRRLWLEAVGL